MTSVFMDLDERRVRFATEGRDSSTVQRFAADLRGHGGYPEAVAFTSFDMSKAFIAGIGEHLPNAEMTFDRYHVVAKANEAVDEVRRAEAKTNPALKKTRYLWLHNHSSLSVKQVLRRQAQPPGPHQGLRQDGREPLGRHHLLAQNKRVLG